MKSESKSRFKNVFTKKTSRESDKVENLEKKQDENSVSVFTKSTNPKVMVGLEKIDDKVTQSNRWCSWKIMKLVFMLVMSILLIITFFVSLRTYQMMEMLVGL